MKHEELQIIKEQYKTKFMDSILYKKALQRKESLEEMSVIQEYNAICNFISMADMPSNSSNMKEYYMQFEILENILDNVDISNSADIYVYFGSFSDMEGSMYYEYRNLETGMNIVMDNLEYSNFERENIVIYPFKGVNIEGYFATLRNIYFTMCMEKGISNATEYMKLKRK